MPGGTQLNCSSVRPAMGSVGQAAGLCDLLVNKLGSVHGTSC